MRGGGVAHGPVLRSFETGLQRKVRKLGLKIALSAKAAEGRIAVLDSLHEGWSRRRWLDGALDKLLGGGALAAGERQHSVLCAEVPPTEEEGALAGRRRCLGARMVLAWSQTPSARARICRVQVMDQFGLNVYDILKHRSLVITKDALEALVKRVEEPIRR